MADFKTAFLRTMGFEDDPRHPGVVTPEPNGGRARLGINSLAHPDLPDYFWTCEYPDALEFAEGIFRREYWDPLKLDSVVSQDVANKVYDMEVNEGLGWVARHLQTVVGVAQDGHVGPATLAAVNSADPVELVQKLRGVSEQRHRELAEAKPDVYGKYLENWLARDEK